MNTEFPTKLIYATAISVGLLALAVAINLPKETDDVLSLEEKPLVATPLSALSAKSSTGIPTELVAVVPAPEVQLDLGNAMEVFGQAVAAGDHQLTSRDLKDIETLMGNLAIQLDNEQAAAAQD